MFNFHVFGYGLTKSEIDRNSSKNIKNREIFNRKKPLWFDGSHLLDKRRNPLTFKVYQELCLKLPISTDAMNNNNDEYSNWPGPLQEQLIPQDEVVANEQRDVHPDDMWYKATIERRSRRFGHKDRIYSQTEVIYFQGRDLAEFQRYTGAVLNRNITMVKRRKFPFNMDMKQFVLRSINLIGLGLAMWKNEQRPTGDYGVSTPTLFLLDKDGNVDSWKWTYAPKPRPIGPKEVAPIKMQRLYDFLLNVLNGGWIFGFTLFGLFWYNWIGYKPFRRLRYQEPDPEGETMASFYQTEKRELESPPY